MPSPPLMVPSHTSDRAPPNPDGQNRPASLPLPYVAYVCFKCFRRFRCMLHLFHMDVAKVDRMMLDMLHILHLLQLQPYVLSVSDVPEVCFIGVFRMQVASVFIWMLHMFHTYVVCVLFGCCLWLQWFSSVFRCFFRVFQKHVSSISSAFRRMLQLLYLNVSKADRGLHLSSSPSAASSWCVPLPMLAGHTYDAAAGSFRIGGVVRPSPLVAQAARAPRRA